MEILKLRENSQLASKAAKWFHSKWGIPLEAYDIVNISLHFFLKDV